MFNLPTFQAISNVLILLIVFFLLLILAALVAAWLKPKATQPEAQPDPNVTIYRKAGFHCAICGGQMYVNPKNRNDVYCENCG